MPYLVGENENVFANAFDIRVIALNILRLQQIDRTYTQKCKKGSILGLY